MFVSAGSRLSRMRAARTFYEPETKAWLAAVASAGGAVSVPQQTLVNNLIVQLQAGGWSKLDVLGLFAVENQAAALVDLKRLASITAVNSPTFTSNQGFTGNGTTASLDMNFNPVSTPGNFVQDSGALFGWHNASGADTGPLVGLNSFATRIGVNNAPFDTLWGVNGGAANAVDPGQSGLYLANRVSAAGQVLDINGSQYASSTTASSAVANTSVSCLAGGGSASSNQICCAGFGGGFTAFERANVFSALRTYMTAVGIA